MDLLASVLVYLGLAAVVVGVLRWRKRGLRVAAAGVIAAAVGVLVPAGETRVVEPRARIDEFVPVYRFSESHAIRVAAPRDRVYRAIVEVCPDEILFYHTLTWIRRYGRRQPAGVLNAPGRRPLLDTMTTGWFLRLADDGEREIVIGSVSGGWSRSQLSRAHSPAEFKDFSRPLMVKIAMNFRIEEEDARHCMLTTETRVYTVGGDADRGFQVYWRLIYPGSSTIRYMWLRAIRKRAEG